MKFAKRSLGWGIAALALLVAMPVFSATSVSSRIDASTARHASVTQAVDRIGGGADTIRKMGRGVESSLLEPEAARGAEMPTTSGQTMDSAPVPVSSMLVFVGAGLIAAALWGRKRFTRS